MIVITILSNQSIFSIINKYRGVIENDLHFNIYSIIVHIAIIIIMF